MKRKLLDRIRIGPAALAVGAIAVLAGLPAIAQDELAARREQTRIELQRIRDEISLSEEKREELAREIGQLETDRATINRNLIETSARARTIEGRIARAETRLDELGDQKAGLRQSLKGRRAVLAEVLAALQRMGRNPPPAILVTPDDALKSVRSAILLGAVVPEIRAETEILATELAELQRIENDIGAERETLRSNLSALAEEEERLGLLLAEKKRLTANARSQLAAQQARAAELAARQNNLGQLIASLEREIESARQAAEAARQAEEERRRRQAEQLAEAREEIARPDFSDTGRIAPAVAFEETKGLLPLPVAGVEVNGFGQRDAFGETASGLSIATRIEAPVVSPADGWVVYAGPFRSYGQLLILNAGSGYHIVMAGMETIYAQLGSFVLAGEPVAMMGARRIASAEAVGVEATRPVLYVEFRKDGKPVDPSPWWAVDANKRATDDS